MKRISILLCVLFLHRAFCVDANREWVDYSFAWHAGHDAIALLCAQQATFCVTNKGALFTGQPMKVHDLWQPGHDVVGVTLPSFASDPIVLTESQVISSPGIGRGSLPLTIDSRGRAASAKIVSLKTSVFVLSGNELQGVNLTTGTTWKASPGMLCHLADLQNDTLLLQQSHPDKILAYSADGKKLWERSIDAIAKEPPSDGEKGVLFFASGNRVYHVSSNGSLCRQWTLPADVALRVVSVNALMGLVFCKDNCLYQIKSDHDSPIRLRRGVDWADLRKTHQWNNNAVLVMNDGLILRAGENSIVQHTKVAFEGGNRLFSSDVALNPNALDSLVLATLVPNAASPELRWVQPAWTNLP